MKRIPIALSLLLVATATARAELPVGLRDVPADAALFWHADVRTLIASPVAKEIYRGMAGQIESLIEDGRHVGIDVDRLDRVTAYFSHFPVNPGEEKNFVVTLTYIEPYEKAKLFPAIRDGGEKAGVQLLKNDLAIIFLDARSLIITHKNLVPGLTGGKKDKPAAGPMTSAIASAPNRHFTQSFNLDELPDELKKNPAEQLRPFLPLLNSKLLTIQADAGKDLALGLTFGCETAEKAKAVKFSFDLLVRILKTAAANARTSTDKGAQLYAPLLNILQKSLDEAEIALVEKEVRGRIVIAAGAPLGDAVKAYVDTTRAVSSRARNGNNLKQIALAMHNYHDRYQGFPASAICSRKGDKLLSWRVAILPFVEQQALYDKFKLDEPWDSVHNKKLLAEMPEIYRMPGDDAKSVKTRCRVFTGNGACFDTVRATKIAEIQDGTSNTVMVATAAAEVEWTKPDDIAFDPKGDIHALLHWENGVCLLAYCDGSVRSISKKVSKENLKAIITKAGGEVVGNIEE